MAARDVMFMGIILFVLGTALFIGHFAMNTAIDNILNTTVVNQSAPASAALYQTKIVSNRADYVVLGLFIGLILALIITGWFIAGNPIFTAIYFIFVIVATLVAGVLGWVWDLFSGASVFGLTISFFPITNHLISNGAFYVAAAGMIGMIVMFAKPYSGGGMPG